MKLNQVIILSLVIVSTCNLGSIMAAQLYVPGQYPTIGSAIDAAVFGDTVIVSDGVYTGEGNRNLDFAGIKVVSENGPYNCVIDCERLSPGFLFYSYAGGDTILSGFTIRNAWHEWSFNGAITCGGSPHISNCILSGNQIAGFCAVESGQPIVTNCLITNNSGSGIITSFVDSTFINCTVTGNVSYGIYAADYSSLSLYSCIVALNSFANIAEGLESQVFCYNCNGSGDPKFVSGPLGDFYLSQTASGQDVDSPAIDNGHDLSWNICFPTVSGQSCLDSFTTRTDHLSDSGTVDIGFHYACDYIAPPSASVDLIMSDTMLKAGDLFKLRAQYVLPDNIHTADLFVMLDVHGQYYFWPDWSKEVKGKRVQFENTPVSDLLILDFVWPDSDFGSADNLYFYAAMFHPDTFNLIGSIDTQEFGYR